MHNKKLVGIFESENEAIKVIKNLKAAGYEDNEISVMAKHSERIDKIEEVTNVDTKATDDVSKAAGGAAIGGILGGIGALLLELGVVAIPGVGPFLAAGPIAVTLAGLIAGGAVGGIAGALIDSGIKEEDAKEYETYLNRGDILVAVDIKENVQRDHILGNYYDNNSIIRDKYNYNRDVNKNDVIR